MKFSVSSLDLLNGLQVAAGAIGSKPVLPILEDFLFNIEGNELWITATDLETAIQTKIEVNADGEGQIAVPGKILLETIKELPYQPITVNIDDSNFSVEITSSYGKYKLAGENGIDFPKIKQADSAESITIPAVHFSAAIHKTLFATSNDELRPAMNGVLFEIGNNKFTAVATDAHKLVKYTSFEAESESVASFIIPKKSLSLLKAIIPASGKIDMAFNRKNVFLKYGDTHVVCRQIDHRFPDYNVVIPIDNPNELVVNRKDFMSSLKRTIIYANKTTNQILAYIQSGSLTLTSQDLDFSNEATEQLTCTFTGEPALMGFNAKFLIEMLTVIDSDEVKMMLSTPDHAGVMYPMEQEDNQELLILVMPIILKKGMTLPSTQE